jgi:hypothetical protein
VIQAQTIYQLLVIVDKLCNVIQGFEAGVTYSWTIDCDQPKTGSKGRFMQQFCLYARPSLAVQVNKRITMTVPVFTPCQQSAISQP